MAQWRFETASECAIMIYFDGELSVSLNESVGQLNSLLKERLAPVLIDLVPSYSSILLSYDVCKISESELKQALILLQQEPLEAGQSIHSSLVHLPVWYSEEVGQDLERVAQQSRLEVDQVIKIHSGNDYRAFALGFAPGFAYLGEVDQRIATPRLETPRVSVPAGSVAIADQQTAVYPAASPGGWNIIGQCPVELFNPTQAPYSLIQPADRVRFVSVNQEAFGRIKQCPERWSLSEGSCV
ncbi:MULTISPECIES: 5-oxoprolinase subunit PxpB [unclassified Marinobacterium]|uniref:5-oxoprolinase subunit PxpB n=1 Tax=unclassified Marinobacterium TaxID=2644139 RepID=UPI0015683D79|nr:MULTISPECIES: 5-oxoprolinase subunit PxpB [unclassified Marinobacterium]NRP56261.1 Kinase A inhibitor [Marinobacterium sp. xm-d-510]NRP96950.1 Kinase A inhibitor [Marinobacterium sp. xm-a-127]